MISIMMTSHEALEGFLVLEFVFEKQVKKVMRLKVKF